MSINLFIEPGVSKSWEQFRRENPPYSIALDGYVHEAPCFDPAGPWINFDHHDGVDRLSTRSTTGQVFLSIKAGLFKTFQKEGIAEANVFVDDPDQDVCPAYWLLKNHEQIAGTKDGPLIIKLVQITDLVDATGGMYPLKMDSKLARERAWLFEPYTLARLTGRLHQMDEPEMRKVIEMVCSRIDQYYAGKGKRIKTDTRYKIIGGGENWKMVIEKGIDARPRMITDGIDAFVSVRENTDGTYTYTLARQSEFVLFPVNKLYEFLNSQECIDVHAKFKWGGSNIIGGSPRRVGSKLKPTELEQLINQFLSAVK